MSFRVANFCGAFTCALQYLLKRSLGKLPLPTFTPARKRMSWVFGIKRQASQQDTTSPETSEQAIEKLQGFHQLVKVLLLLHQHAHAKHAASFHVACSTCRMHLKERTNKILQGRLEMQQSPIVLLSMQYMRALRFKCLLHGFRVPM